MFIRSICRLATALALAAAPLGGAHADAPYLTDDPDPTDYRQFEIYLYAAGVEDGGANSGTPLGLEINYGALPDMEISASVPAGFIAPASNQPTFAISEAEFGIKYRFIEEDEAG